jgi:NADPH:quinone reductase-like Zn-dependent oxidoreductase
MLLTNGNALAGRLAASCGNPPQPRGIVCMTGMVGSKWSIDNFNPMDMIPSAVCLTTYDGGSMRTPLEELIKLAAGTLHVNGARVFHLDEIVEAHRVLVSNTAGGKIVLLTLLSDRPRNNED